ncbi:30S ribosomal protein S16 [Candidatus Saccharibacteria bacterium]|nr:30S ribosomal protein S16 [Candidatus Saccharibacteria bacterium]
MLAIRLQRLGRKGYPVYRLAVQESQRHPSSGRVVAYVGSYNPHTKEANIQKEAAEKFLENGAQPTPRVVKLFKEAGVVLPKWVKQFDGDKTKAVRNADKLRKNQPKTEPVAE